jgi:LmbE family N-acetylglucosaminyl deacetylase
MNNKIIRTALALLFVSLLITAPRAQQPPAGVKQSPEDRIALYQALLDLTNPWTVMCIAAHPDDEDGTSLIVMRRKYGAHTVSLFSTFGEGGQNAIGPELYEELGAIRARETMAAAEIQGSEPHFLGLKDFGYSKSADEAFKFWGHDEALRRMVLEIRKLRPDVIITNHSVTSNDHGHHQATARLELEAFDAAADPTKFPEQLKDGVTVWQVQRLFVRARGNAAQNTNPQGGGEQIVAIDPNERDPIRDVVFAEEALRALQKHATQGPWPKTFAEYATRFRAFSGQQGGTPGQLPSIRYRLTREAKGAEALPSNSTNFADGLRVPDNVAKLQFPTIEGKPLTEFASQPDRVFDALATSATFRPERLNLHTPGQPDDSHLRWISERSAAALALAGGITATLSSQNGVVVRGTRAAFILKVVNKGSRSAQIMRVPFNGLTTFSVLSVKPKLNPGETTEVDAADQIGPDEKITVPHSGHLYDGGYAGRQERGSLLVEIANHSFQVPYKLNVGVAPAVEIADISPSPVVIRPDEVGVSSAGADVFPAKLPELRIQLINYLDQRFNGEVLLGEKNQKEQTRRTVELLPHQITTLALPMPSPEKSTAAHAKSSAPGEALSIAVRATNSRENITTREVPIVRANAHVTRNLRVGYIRGFDFSLPNALNALGVESKDLSVDEVKTADLQKYTSIIVDNRVYESQPELIAANQKLLDYANAGGTLIVFYHKSNEWNPDERRKRPQLAPYKLLLGDERITDETAPITFIEPEHPLLNTPNKMGQEDFANWIQERGLYYPKDWDPQFHALLQSNDPGEAPLKGGLLVADYGRGHYIYTSMVWYRELRAGVPGAYRMLANMISYGRAEGKR